MTIVSSIFSSLLLFLFVLLFSSWFFFVQIIIQNALCTHIGHTTKAKKKHTLCKKETQKCEKLRRARWLDDACDAMRWFEYNIRSSFFFMHSHLDSFHPPPFGRSIVVHIWYFARVFCSLNTISTKFLFFDHFLFHLAFGRFLFFFTLRFGNLQWLSTDRFLCSEIIRMLVRDRHYRACVLFMLFCLTVTLNRWLCFCFVHTFC